MEYEVVEQDEIECLSPKDVMGLLRLSKSEVYQLFNSKDFPCFLVGERSKRITKRDFKIWLMKKKEKTV
ncbi:helix-turn-helix domain-containing protein [Cellulosilyticum sp. ST5]|uniref:helix-turn-helix domain-containing protein n=1 Tax=Cellulosilyticum sp. ST5 TaxID=3055805 RepID=UPI003977B6B8